MSRHESEMHRQRRELWHTLQTTTDWLSDALNLLQDYESAEEYREAVAKARAVLKKIRPS